MIVKIPAIVPLPSCKEYKSATEEFVALLPRFKSTARCAVVIKISQRRGRLKNRGYYTCRALERAGLVSQRVASLTFQRGRARTDLTEIRINEIHHPRRRPRSKESHAS